MFKLEFDREHLWQWDLNQRLILTEVEAGVEVHFSHPFIADLDKALPVYTYEENGVICADIPNRVLQVSGYFKAYIYESGREDEAHTKMSISVDIKERKQPADYIYEETDIISYAMLEKRIKKLEDKDDVSDEQVAKAVESYLSENPIQSDLPKVDESDNGKVLIVDGGKWSVKELPKYEGAYTIKPSIEDTQTLKTSQRFMDADVVIEKIPYAEVTNKAGGLTATIGIEEV